MSKIQTISGRSSFATVCETARRMGYRLLVCSNSKTYLLKGWKVAVVPTEKVAEYLQAQAPQNPVSTPETEPNKPPIEHQTPESYDNEETDTNEASAEEARADE